MKSYVKCFFLRVLRFKNNQKLSLTIIFLFQILSQRPKFIFFIRRTFQQKQQIHLKKCLMTMMLINFII